MQEKEKRPNPHLQRERELKGWSQRTLAERLDTTEQVVNRWESGHHKPNRHFQTHLCQLFGKRADELGFMGEPQKTTEEESRTDTERASIPEQPSPSPLKQSNEIQEMLLSLPQFTFQDRSTSISEPGGIDLDTLRRDLLQQMLSFVGAVAISPTFIANRDGLNRLSYDPVQLFSIDETTPETLESFATLTEICRQLSEGSELKTTERILWSYLPRVESIAKLSFKDQRKAADIVSQSYLLAASLAGHHNNLQARHQLSEQALLYGKLAQDRNLQIAALRQLSITFDYLECPDKVLQIYQQTFPYINEISPLLRACIYAGVSGAYAQLKQKQEALRFIDLAYEHFPTHPEHEPSFLHIICRYSTLIFFDGLNHLDLGQSHEAEKVLARIDGLQPKIQIPERVRIELLNYQIEVFTVLKYMEQACTYLEAAAKASLVVGSERRFQESFALFQQMQNVWPNETQVQELRDLFVR